MTLDGSGFEYVGTFHLQAQNVIQGLYISVLSDSLQAVSPAAILFPKQNVILFSTEHSPQLVLVLDLTFKKSEGQWREQGQVTKGSKSQPTSAMRAGISVVVTAHQTVLRMQ